DNSKSSDNKSCSAGKRKETRVTAGRKVFVTMVTEIEAIFMVIKKVYINSITHTTENASDKVFKDEKEKKKYFRLAYDVFFMGYDYFVESIPALKKEFSSTFLDSLRKELYCLRDKHKKGELSCDEHDPKRVKGYLKKVVDSNCDQNETECREIDLKLYFNYKPFSGHQSRLGHYFRHMFNLVKHVVKQPLTL